MKKIKGEENIKMIIKDKNIFVKIREIFTNFFKKSNETDEKQNQKSNIQEGENFKDKLKIDMRIANLQTKLKMGQTTLKDIDKTDKRKIIKLYEKQIAEKKNKLSGLEKKIKLQ